MNTSRNPKSVHASPPQIASLRLPAKKRYRVPFSIAAYAASSSEPVLKSTTPCISSPPFVWIVWVAISVYEGSSCPSTVIAPAEVGSKSVAATSDVAKAGSGRLDRMGLRSSPEGCCRSTHPRCSAPVPGGGGNAAGVGGTPRGRSHRQRLARSRDGDRRNLIGKRPAIPRQGPRGAASSRPGSAGHALQHQVLRERRRGRVGDREARER